MKTEKPKFFAFCKDFNDGKIRNFDVLEPLFCRIFNSSGSINRKEFRTFGKGLSFDPVETKEQLKDFIDSHFRYHYWAKCEWEFLAVDWPNRDAVEDSRPVKIDVYEQLKPNLDMITDIVWNYIEPKVIKSIKK